MEDILECKVKWALGSITANKASGGDEIPVELFKALKEGLRESDMTERLHFHFSLSCVGEGNGNPLVFLPGESQGREPHGLTSVGSHRVGHD